MAYIPKALTDLYKTFKITGSSGTTTIYLDDESSYYTVNYNQTYNFSSYSFATNIVFVGGNTTVSSRVKVIFSK